MPFGIGQLSDSLDIELHHFIFWFHSVKFCGYLITGQVIRIHSPWLRLIYLVELLNKHNELVMNGNILNRVNRVTWSIEKIQRLKNQTIETLDRIVQHLEMFQ